MNKYIGHETQVYGVEEHRLIGGKGDGQRLYEIHNGVGLDLTVSPDRAGDITRLRYKGINMNFMSAAGYARPAYYDHVGAGFLKAFTAGFLTTCGFENVGSPNGDQGDELGLHGSICMQPAEQSYWTEEGDMLCVRVVTTQGTLFGRKFKLDRTIAVSTKENVFEIRDTITNTGDTTEPYEILYHMNMGYPLLDEDSVVTIPSAKVVGRDDHAANDIANWMNMEKPQDGYQEKCYYHTFADENGSASIFQPKLGMGLTITFDTRDLDCLCEWKSMRTRDYALGLECGNCLPDGRDIMREKGILKFLAAGESKTYTVRVTMNDAE